MQRRSFLSAMLAAAAASPAFAQARQTPPALPIIEPQNALERALLAATDPGAGEPERDAFRRLFLRSEVALALSSNSPDSPPAQIEPRAGFRTCLIFTSNARVTEIMGAGTPRVVITGRQALERVRGTNVVININRRPFITLDAEGVEGFLALPEGRETAPQPAPPPPPASAGPTQ
ncbi:MAG TPA: hypothetical protein VEF55_01620 [Candidatus Binatia bacterium]|nr:hypothetical protein [Candidatus Binatia bacterium]